MLKRPRYRLAKHVMKRKETRGSLLTLLTLLLSLETATLGRAMPFNTAIGRGVPFCSFDEATIAGSRMGLVEGKPREGRELTY
jgi:hypothetical protein